MRGQQPTLPDIVLHEVPEPVSLYCDEQLEEEEEQPALYTLYTLCGRCCQRLKLTFRAFTQTKITLETLLLGDLDLFCPPCAA
ncbi:putative transforming protein E7 [Ovis aries papillomavirus 3]|uniref:Protein E7 n=1 Tax=Ovis aries papillomavirus 3 TaxID=634772 RepID=D5FL26_9PAPI|nr:putative transforming protein E7 [Ovis aries papillomavirus 3]ACO58657.1 putative transforming protein E7 [Ovis aries papillomavirus 3]